MLNFILWNDATGSQENAVSCASATQLPTAPEGCSWHPIQGAIDTTTLRLVDGVLSECPRTVPLAELQRARRAEVGTLLAQRIDAPFLTSYGLVQCDKDSREALRSKATRAAGALQNGADFTERWRLLDNGYTPDLNAAQMIAFAAEVDDHSDACIQASFRAKDAIDAATDAAGVAAVDISGGYPAA